MSGKLIIQGKAWGEFENAKRSKGNIEISGYRSYGGTHTVRMVDQSQLNENQQIVLDWLKIRSKGGNSPFAVVQGFRGFNGVPSLEINSLISLSIAEESQVLEVFSRWVQEQEEE